MVTIRKLKVTCVERKYKVQSDKVIYMIKAMRELDEDLTEKLLHEDMELKTFLSEYEIENVEEKEVPKIETIEITSTKSKKIEETKVPMIDISIKRKKGKIEEKPVLEVLEVPTPLQRERVIIDALPEEFALEDIIKFHKERNEKYGDILKLKRLYSYTLQHLRRHGMVEFINPDVNRRYRRYRKIEGAAEKMKDMNEEQTISLEATL